MKGRLHRVLNLNAKKSKTYKYSLNNLCFRKCACLLHNFKRDKRAESELIEILNGL